jgi:hypothetical protein
MFCKNTQTCKTSLFLFTGGQTEKLANKKKKERKGEKKNLNHMFPIGNLIADSTPESGSCGSRRRRASAREEAGGGRRRWQKSAASLAHGHLAAARQAGGRNGQGRTAVISTDTWMIVSASNVLQDRLPVMIPVDIESTFVCFRSRREKLSTNHHNQSPTS